MYKKYSIMKNENNSALIKFSSGNNLALKIKYEEL